MGPSSGNIRFADAQTYGPGSDVLGGVPGAPARRKRIPVAARGSQLCRAKASAPGVPVVRHDRVAAARLGELGSRGGTQPSNGPCFSRTLPATSRGPRSRTRGGRRTRLMLMETLIVSCPGTLPARSRSACDVGHCCLADAIRPAVEPWARRQCSPSESPSRDRRETTRQPRGQRTDCGADTVVLAVRRLADSR